MMGRNAAWGRRILGILVLTIGVTVSAAHAAGADTPDRDELLNETTITLYDDLPANDGAAIGEVVLAELPTDEILEEARYVQATVDDRSYLFAIAGVAPGKEITVDFGAEPSDDESAVSNNLVDVVELLAGGIRGTNDVLITSRREGDVNVVTGLHVVDSVDPTLPVQVEAESSIALLRGGTSTLYTVSEGGATLADVSVREGDASAPLLTDGAWHEPGAAGMGAAGASPEGETDGEDAGAEAGEAAEGPATGDQDVGLGMPLE